MAQRTKKLHEIHSNFYFKVSEHIYLQIKGKLTFSFSARVAVSVTATFDRIGERHLEIQNMQLRNTAEWLSLRNEVQKRKCLKFLSRSSFSSLGTKSAPSKIFYGR